MGEGAQIRCERCGASVPLLVDTHARCLYCRHDNAVPAEMRGHLARREHLDREVERAMSDGGGVVAAQRRSMIFLGLFIGAILVVNGIALIAKFIVGPALEGGEVDPMVAMTFGLMFCSWIPFAAIPVAWILLVRKKKQERWARLPLAIPTARADAVGAVCPSCGAALAASATQIFTRCGHCSTEALLPLPMVQGRLRKMHAKVVEMRERVTAEEVDAVKDAVKTWQTKFVPVIIGFNVLIGIVIFAGVIIYRVFFEP